MPKEKISVVVPAFNEEGNIPILVEKIVKSLKTLNQTGEIIIIDDGSSDNTKKEIKEITKKYDNVKPFFHRKNMGLSKALMTGFKNCQGEIIVFLPADLQSDPEEDIPILISAIDEGYDLVAGWRQGKRDGKVFVSKIYNFLSKLLFGVAFHDLNWIKAFRHEVIKDINLRSDWHRYIVPLAAHRGFKIKEVKTNFYPRKFGKSKFGKKRILKGFLDLLVVKFELSFIEKPMLLFGGAGLISFALGFIVGAVLVVQKIITGIGSRAALFLVMVLLIIGVQLFAIGFLAELIVSIKEKINK